MKNTRKIHRWVVSCEGRCSGSEGCNINWVANEIGHIDRSLLKGKKKKSKTRQIEAVLNATYCIRIVEIELYCSLRGESIIGLTNQ